MDENLPRMFAGRTRRGGRAMTGRRSGVAAEVLGGGGMRTGVVAEGRPGVAAEIRTGVVGEGRNVRVGR